MKTTLCAYIDGIGMLGPGFDNWPSATAVLRGEVAYRFRPCVLPAPALLPPAERRRCGPIIKLSLAIGLEAAEMAGLDIATLATVFSASGGDGANCHEICEMLASDDRLISPTRFHNSVHNAAAGYWSIAAKARATSSVLCAYDGSFGAGLLEALTQVVVERIPCLVIAGDTSYPQPLQATRPIPDAFGVALALTPNRSEHSIARVCIDLCDGEADKLDDPGLETVRTSIPAARSLPLLRALARCEAAMLTLDYLENRRLTVQVTPCN
ncbi:MAG: beta-ketoacyl synthase chain length factor [Pseudomonadota bacterium]